MDSDQPTSCIILAAQEDPSLGPLPPHPVFESRFQVCEADLKLNVAEDDLNSSSLM